MPDMQPTPGDEPPENVFIERLAKVHATFMWPSYPWDRLAETYRDYARENIRTILREASAARWAVVPKVPTLEMRRLLVEGTRLSRLQYRSVDASGAWTEWRDVPLVSDSQPASDEEIAHG